MKPVAIFRFSRTEGPDYFATFLDAHGIPWKLFALDAGELVPSGANEYSGFAFMGGPMSANDALPWREPVLALIRAAVDGGQPCIGHCLGGQLMSKALGGTVAKNEVKEIGWHTLMAEDNQEARAWLGGQLRCISFQWHGETFSLPPGATRILTGPNCANQAYVLGPHLGMQCHVEMTETMIATWCEDGADEIGAALAEGQPQVAAPPTILDATALHLPALRVLADTLYRRWITGLARP